MTEQSSTRSDSAAQDETASPFDPSQWREVEGFASGVDLTDLTYHRHVGEGRVNGIVRIAFDRPEVRNAFRPHTVDELYRVFDHARRSPDVGTVLFTGNGPSPKDGGWAFCSGGDQRIRGGPGAGRAGGRTRRSRCAASPWRPAHRSR